MTVLHLGASTIKNIGEKGGPTKAKIKHLDPWYDGGCICGNKVPIEGFVMMRKFRCDNYIESQYYTYMGSAANGGRGRLITADFCAILSAHNNIVSRDEIIKMQDVGEKNLLQICKYFFDSILKVPISGSFSNTRQNKNQSLAKNKKQLKKAVAYGWRKGEG